MKKDKSLDFKNEKERQEFINDVKDEMIQEYRKASAEALGGEIYLEVPSQQKGYYMINGHIIFWHPDTDLNQMGMIEDWLTKDQQRDVIQYTMWIRDGKVREEWYLKYTCAINERHYNDFLVHNESEESKSIAFMKAFMEYIKQ